jgi:hypothetical protein
MHMLGLMMDYSTNITIRLLDYWISFLVFDK